MTVSLGLVAWAFSHVDKAPAVASIPKGYGTTAIVGAHVYVFFFAMSWGVVVWVLLGEMFPNKIRALALSVAARALAPTRPRPRRGAAGRATGTRPRLRQPRTFPVSTTLRPPEPRTQVTVAPVRRMDRTVPRPAPSAAGPG